ncbi:MAG: hypothetical protein A3G87_03590 [Omnitrophica bacterium RIFCSPLOWO2_12_FULL_50_11]|nr:MAG: hypothetical protein A3G87_03590 [Omnitrophica bacterium RIFCSPLOWO2_12_FULL_50_11]
MRLVFSIVAFIFLNCFLFPATLSAYWIWSPAEGKFVQPEGTSKRTAKEQYDYAQQLREAEEEDKFMRALEDLVEHYPRSAYAPEAQYMLAVLYEDKGDYDKAAGAFKKLIRDLPRSERIDRAMEHLFKIGNLYLTGRKQKLLGVAMIAVLPKAVEIFQFIMEAAPYGPYGDQAQMRLGIVYQRMGKLQEAVEAFERLIANYPNSVLLEEAHYLLAETSYELSQAAGQDQQIRRNAAEHIDSFISDYAAGSLAERAQLLKRQLDEQDAEKNYRIGLYYEKWGFVESAMIYYEDVSQRYPDTAFGKKAAERFKNLTDPLRVLEQTEEVRERRLAEVESMLKALDQKETEEKVEAAVTSETVELRQQLESEKTSLLLAEERSEQRTAEQYRDRAEALRQREKNLKTKFKTFTKRHRKMVKEHPSAELEAAFSRWEASLFKEQEELRKEREVLEELGAAVRKIKWPSLNWVPFVGPGRLPSVEEVVEFKEERWEKLARGKDRVHAERTAYEEELVELTKQIDLLQEQEFQTAKRMPVFHESLPETLKDRQAAMMSFQGELDQMRRSVKTLRHEYESRYGEVPVHGAVRAGREPVMPAATGTGSLNPSPAEPVPLAEQKLAELHTENALLSQAWLDQKKKVATLASAVGGVQPRVSWMDEDVVPSFGALSEGEQSGEVRLLKKRLKFLEREIRGRLDQIQDWEQKNSERIDRLDYLLHANPKTAALSGTVQKAVFPIAGAYKLGKMFIFGVGDRDRDLLAEAKQVLSQGKGDDSSEDLDQIRSLVDEVELQSMLIEGRVKEIAALNKDLKELRARGERIPGFSYQSMLMPRYPASLEHSIESARGFVEGENQDNAYRSRLEQEQTELSRLEKSLSEMEPEIGAVATALEQAQKQEKEAAARKAQVAVSLEGDAEQLPTRVEPDEREQLASQRAQLDRELAAKEKEYESASNGFENDLVAWYRTEGRNQISAQFPGNVPEGASSSYPYILEADELLERHKTVQEKLTRARKEEYGLVSSQKEFLNKKLGELEKRLERLKDFRDPSDTHRNALTREMERSRKLDESLIQELLVLEGSLKK